MAICKSLLPSNQKSFVKELDVATCEALQSIDPQIIRKVWNPWKCPLSLLPFLAWSVSVDEWDDDWAENQKRQVVADSIWNHWHKGTNPTLRDAISKVGLPFEYIEWWETEPRGERGTAVIEIQHDGRRLNEDWFQRLQRLIYANKRATIHHTVRINTHVDIEQTQGVGVVFSSVKRVGIQLLAASVAARSQGIAVRFQQCLSVYPRDMNFIQS